MTAPPQKPSGGRPWGAIIAIVLLSLFCIALASFGVWAYTGRQDYKNNVDGKIAQAVKLAVQQEGTLKDKQFVELQKLPLKSYQGPPEYGSINVQYPKTWSAFITKSDGSSTPIDGYLHPDVVPGLQSGTAFALRIQVLSQPYDQVMQSFGQQAVTGKLAVAGYRAPKVPGVLGSRIDGAINTGQQDSMVVFPLRDKTLEISTQSSEFLNDFNNNILANLTFSP